MQIPMLPLESKIVCPQLMTHFEIKQSSFIKAIDQAMQINKQIFVIMLRHPYISPIQKEDLYTVGTIATIKKVIKVSDTQYEIFVKGEKRANLVEIDDIETLSVTIEPIEDSFDHTKPENEALNRILETTFERYATLNPRFTEEMIKEILAIESPIERLDKIIGSLMIKAKEKQELFLECLDNEKRFFKMIEILERECDILSVQKEILLQVKKNLDKSQKEYFLREQMKIIQEKLGDKEGLLEEIAEFESKIQASVLPKEVVEKLNKEIRRLKYIPSNAPESSNLRVYIETVLDLPWSKQTKESLNLKKAKQILDKEHYGLTKIKERVIEYLAVKKISPQVPPPILCLVGPPGVGKTSIARSIAHAMNRNYVRISLGGVTDEAEIRGHRRTYVSAMPGRFINALIEAKSSNPLILIDEIDKMSRDYKGDPTAALLEVLDTHQNHTFKDRYLELPVDLSHVLFITTANTIKDIPRPLLDRMEVIEVSSYTVLEKLEIAQRYLVPQQLEKHDLTKENLKISKTTLRYLIEHYTKEAGVRELERLIEAICRKAAKDMVEQDVKSIEVHNTKLKDYLGIPLFEYEPKNEQAEVGVVRGLAWTSVGGDTLFVEVNCMKGKGKLELTGKMGEVMQESAKAAVSYIRSQASTLGIAEDFYLNQDIHVHIPEGAIPKDGPSAGITMATAMISALTGQKVCPDLAMTGEITIRGRILPIGGLKEKLLAAKRARIHTVLVPAQNKKNVEDLEMHIVDNLEIIYVSKMNEVLEYVFAN